MIIVCGKLLAQTGGRDELLELSKPAVEAAREAPGCLDFAVSADLVDPDRVNVLERWTDAKSLAAFRNSGPGDDISRLVRRFDVQEFEIAD